MFLQHKQGYMVRRLFNATHTNVTRTRTPRCIGALWGVGASAHFTPPNSSHHTFSLAKVQVTTKTRENMKCSANTCQTSSTVFFLLSTTANNIEQRNPVASKLSSSELKLYGMRCRHCFRSVDPRKSIAIPLFTVFEWTEPKGKRPFLHESKNTTKHDCH